MNWIRRHCILVSIVILPVVMFISGALMAEMGGFGILFLMLSLSGLVLFVVNEKHKEANNANK